MARRFSAPLITFRDQLDAMLIRGPSPLLPAFSALARANNIASVLLLVGSNVEGICDLPQPRWRKELIRIHNQFNQRQQDKSALYSLTFVNSRRLYKQYYDRIPYLVETRTTTLREQDFYEREDTCQNLPIRLLYTGRFDRSKGLLEIIEALALLVRNGHNVVLDLVGWDDSNTGVGIEIRTMAEKLGVSARVINHGRKTIGPQLFSHYRSADIYVMASKSDFEGFPRTIWEAMAHSLPVVATNVGSISEYLSGAAEIVKPSNVDELASAIGYLIKSPERRKEIIMKGRLLAMSNTLNRRSCEMITCIETWLRERRICDNGKEIIRNEQGN